MDPEALRDELEQTVRAINEQIAEIRLEALRMNIEPTRLRTPTGGWVMPQLLTAKAQVLYGLALVGFREEEVDDAPS